VSAQFALARIAKTAAVAVRLGAMTSFGEKSLLLCRVRGVDGAGVQRAAFRALEGLQFIGRAALGMSFPALKPGYGAATRALRAATAPVIVFLSDCPHGTGHPEASNPGRVWLSARAASASWIRVWVNRELQRRFARPLRLQRLLLPAEGREGARSLPQSARANFRVPCESVRRAAPWT